MLALAAFLLCAGARNAAAQEFRGTISGTVTDTTGAVVPNATVTAREVNTGTLNRTTSNSAGQYVIPFLLPGTYTIQAEAAGFQKLDHPGISLESQGHLIVNLALQIGANSETVTVTSAPPLIDLADASVGSVIQTESVADLPINGRAPTTLVEMAPGVISTGSAAQLIHPFDNNAGNQWSIGGTPNQVSEVLLDGSPDLTLLGAVAFEPTQDSVAEVSVRPFDTDASFGHTIGGVINQITKSGTNQLHGTLYWFNQIPNFDGNLWFNSRRTPVPSLPVTHYNQYGLTAGGPILIPKIYNGRDKAFFFFAWERLKDSQPSEQTLTVPTQNEIGGDFSQTLAASSSNQLYNPFTATSSGKTVSRTAIPNNDLTSLGVPFDPIALNYLKLFPGHNAIGLSDGENNYISNAPSIDAYDNEFGRADYNLSSADHIFFDFRHNYRDQTKNDYFGNGITGTILLRENYGSTLDNVFTLNPTTVFDVRFNWTHFNEVHGTPATKYSPNSLGFPSYMSSSSELQQMPFINFGTGGSCGSHTSYQCLGDTGSALDPTTSYQVFADMVKVVGQNTLKIGFDGRQYRMSIQNFGASSGTFTFNSSWVNSGTTGGVSNIFGGDLAAFMLGLASSGSYNTSSRADYHSYYIGTFVQDDLRVNNRLTLNLGLRFDIDTPFEERLGRTVNGFNPTAAIAYTTAPSFSGASTTGPSGTVYSVASINTAGGLTFPNQNNGAVYGTNSGFFSPRLGFSFAVDNQTALRGGFGIFVEPESLANLAASGTYSSSAISNQEGYSASTSFLATTNNYQSPSSTLSSPYPSGFLPAAGSTQGASTFLGQSLSFLAPSQHDAYSERWDLGFQRSIGSKMMVEALYVGNHGVHLPIESQNINAVERQYLSTNPYRDEDLIAAYSTSVTNPFKGTLPPVEGIPNSTSTNSSSKVSLASLMVPYPQFGGNSIIEQNQTRGQSWFDEAIVHFERRAARGLTLTANYSYSKMIEDITLLNDEDPAPTRRISTFDHPEHFTVGGTYNLPFGQGQQFAFGGSKLMNQIAGGWVLNGIYQFQTGAPIEFSADIPLQPSVNIRDITNNPREATLGVPALSTNLFVTGNSTKCPTSGPCDGSALINGQYSYHYRTLPQTMSWVREDGNNNLDASVLKEFHFTEDRYLQLRFETFNLLNHPTFNAPAVSSATSSSFGYISSVESNSLPRQVQLGARIVF